MFSPIIRVTLFVALLGAATSSFVTGNDFGGVALLLVSIFIILDYYRSGSVWIAFRNLRKGNFERAEKHLSQTKYNKWLRNTHKSSYHTIEGYLYLQKNDLSNALKCFVKGAEFGFRSSQDRVMNFINQVNILIKLEKINPAKKKFIELKELNSKGFEKEIKRLNQYFDA